MKTRKTKKLVSLLACMTMIFVFTIQASAATNPGAVIQEDWKDFRGNQENNAVTSYQVPNTADSAMLYWTSKNGTGWSAAPGSPILVDGYLYFNAGKELVKMDAVSGEIVAKGEMVDRSPFSICPPTYANGKVFVGLSGGIVQAFDAKTMKSLWVYKDELGGQPNTPITYYDNCIYLGFWASETRDAHYVCITVKDENTKKTKEAKKAKWTYTSAGGFYWAGAYACKNFVAVGTDDGQNGNTSQTASLITFNPKTGKVLDKAEGLNGDIRSNVSYDKQTDRYYCTSKGGSLYSMKISAAGKISDLKKLDLGGMSTSTPAIYNGRAYVGVSGSGQFTKYNGHNITVVDLEKWEIAYTAPTMGYPQTSGLVCTAYENTEGCVYVYFFENYTPGKLRYIKDKPGQTELISGTREVVQEGSPETGVADILFTPQGDHAQYTICSPIVDEYGTIYFKNDSCYMMALGSKIEKIEVTKNPTQTTYDIGDPVNLSGIKATAYLANGKTRDISAYVESAESEITEGQTDITITYPYALYNDAGTAEPIFTTVDIKVNSPEVSKANNRAKAAIKASTVKSVKTTAGKKKVAVSWKKVTGATGYQVQRAASKSGKYTTVKTTSAASYTNTGLTAKKTYYYKVRAYKTINGVKYYGKWSSVKSATTK